jgi:hypothetical protein
MAHNIADFMGRKPSIDGDGHVMEPEFGFFIARPDMDMRRLVAFVGIEEGAIRPPPRPPSGGDPPP